MITCHEVLARYNEHCGVIGKPPLENVYEFKDLSDLKCIPFDPNTITINNNIVLEEYAFEVENKAIASIKAHFEFLDTSCRMVVVSNETFKDFVTLSTEVITRNKIDPKTGTVASGALFSEEYLPPETVLFSLLQNGPVNKANVEKDFENADQVQKFLKDNLPEVFQLGGNATIGKGIVKTFKGGEK